MELGGAAMVQRRMRTKPLLVLFLFATLLAGCTHSTDPARTSSSAAAASPAASPACALIVNAACAIHGTGVAPAPGQPDSMYSQPVEASVTLRRGGAVLAQRSFDGTTCFALPPGPVEIDVAESKVCGSAHLKAGIPGIASIDCNRCPQPAAPEGGPGPLAPIQQ